MLLTKMLISNSTNQSPINDTEDINIHSSNDEKWAGNYFSPYQISRKGFRKNYAF